MNQIDHPRRFPIPFANNAGASYIRTVPQAHQAATGGDAPASLFDGFPPECFVPESSGGIPPNGKDFNGILRDITDGLQWLQSGGPALFDSDFSTAIGGYPKGARLASAVTAGVEFISLVDGNTTDPDSGGSANWAPVGVPAALLATSGYEVRPSGIVDLWGRVTVGQDSSATVSLTSLFPGLTLSAVYNLQLSWADSTIGSGSPQGASGFSAPSASGFTIYNDGNSRVHHWRALGVKA
jgi:hypothetical protein